MGSVGRMRRVGKVGSMLRVGRVRRVRCAVTECGYLSSTYVTGGLVSLYVLFSGLQGQPVG